MDYASYLGQFLMYSPRLEAVCIYNFTSIGKSCDTARIQVLSQRDRGSRLLRG
jgi:hypothetical protein